MADESPKRVKRLISIREIQREQAGAEVAIASGQRDEAADRVKETIKAVEREEQIARFESGQPMDPAEIQMVLGCLMAKIEQVENDQEVLSNAQDNLEKKTDELLTMHQRVKQMEALSKIWQERQTKKSKLKEQREIDDLVAARETKS